MITNENTLNQTSYGTIELGTLPKEKFVLSHDYFSSATAWGTSGTGTGAQLALAQDGRVRLTTLVNSITYTSCMGHLIFVNEA